MSAPLLEVAGLSLAYATRRGAVQALQGVSLAIPRGGAMGLVGESGSGKSSLVLALLGLLGKGASLSAERMRFAEDDLRAAAARLRGARIGTVFQDPAGALNPALRVGLQVAEPLMQHRGLAPRAALARAVELLGEMGLPRPAEVADAYPHQLSGGMKQRAVIATALACEPELLLLDEPTTALDVTVEAQILDLLERLRRERGVAMLLVSHNLGIVDRLCEEVTVLYAGRVVEQGPVQALLSAPLHPYTRGLLAALPRADRGGMQRLRPIPGSLPDLTRPDPGCHFRPRCPFAAPGCEAPQALRPAAAPEPGRGERGGDPAGLVRAAGVRRVLCHRAEALAGTPWPAEEAPPAARPPIGGTLLEAEGLAKRFRLGGGVLRLLAPRAEVRAVDGVSLALRRGEVLGLVGESGSGKSTLGRLLLRLLPADAGAIRLEGAPVPAEPGPGFRRRAQIVFQNPDGSLNPRQTVEQALLRPLLRFGIASGAAAEREVDRLLELVRLGPAYRARYPHQMSGGEKQRVAIARALASRPDLLVCDEAVSALDVSVQAAVLNLLEELRDRLGVGYLFISHDIGVVAHIADRIAVMYRGGVVEEGPVEAVLAPPYHPYTQALLSAVPLLGRRERAGARLRLAGDVSTPAPARGCRFAHRCPARLGPVCEEQAPPPRLAGPGHVIACHRPLEELARAPHALLAAE
ncbi:dipeptide ABC transporter ATP-binding protein [Rubritepida flocculans]|uniref:dipeptide ABC transporter ATP-binding protein n=1 Tax=Rubritepida flocculans TaxID=182403 RepID=UPI000407D442|nr:ABC transporter ATP-binding protein [Rubritepida flocculans]